MIKAKELFKKSAFMRTNLFRRSIKHWWQRRTRGWDDSDTWSLDFTIAKFVLPRLKKFREIDFGYPGNMSEEEWREILDKMIYAMEFNAKDEIIMDKEENEKIQEGNKLFGKYFNSLWW